MVTKIVFFIILGIIVGVGFWSLRRLKYLVILNLAFGVMLFSSVIMSTYRNSTLLMAIVIASVMITLPMLFLNFIGIVVFFVEHLHWSFIPLGIWILSICLGWWAVHLGQHLQASTFKKRLNQYEEVVSMLEKQVGDVPVSLAGGEIPREYRHLAYLIDAQRDQNGYLIVTFTWSQCWFMSWEGFVYQPAEVTPSRTTPWTLVHPGIQLAENWYRVWHGI